MTVADNVSTRLLIADDNLQNRKFMGEICSTFGWAYDFAEDGVECVSAIEKDRAKYSVILMDIHMPNKSGVEAAAEIRDAKADPPKNIPIIAISADDSLTNRRACDGAGIDHFMEKPVDIMKLKALVETLI